MDKRNPLQIDLKCLHLVSVSPSEFDMSNVRCEASYNSLHSIYEGDDTLSRHVKDN